MKNWREWKTTWWMILLLHLFNAAVLAIGVKLLCNGVIMFEPPYPITAWNIACLFIGGLMISEVFDTWMWAARATHQWLRSHRDEVAVAWFILKFF